MEKNDLRIYLGIEDAEIFMITNRKEVSLNDPIYQDKLDRRLFPIKEIVIDNYKFNKDQKITVHGYYKDKKPVLCFNWEYSGNNDEFNEYDMSGIRRHLVHIIDEYLEEELKAKDLKLVSENWERFHKSSWELAEEKKKENPKHLSYQMYSETEVFIEISESLSDYPTVKECIELYDYGCKLFYDLYKNIFKYLSGMKATDEFKKYLANQQYKEKTKARARIFVSYSGKYKEQVRSLLSRIHIPKVDFWFDQNEINLGDFLDEKIESGISNSDGFIFIVTDDVSNKFYPKSELALATQKQQSDESYFIIPIIYTKTNKLTIPLELSRRTYIEVLNDDGTINEDSIEKLKIELSYKGLQSLEL